MNVRHHPIPEVRDKCGCKACSQWRLHDQIETLTRERDEARSERDRKSNGYDAALQELDRRIKERNEARAMLLDVEAQLERWKHGEQIEGDYECPDSVALNDARARLAELERERDAALAERHDLRSALRAVVVLCGGSASRDVSTEFLLRAPREVEAIVAARDAAQARVAALEAERENLGWHILHGVELRDAIDKCHELTAERDQARAELARLQTPTTRLPTR